jgi:AcrR family transcriptional regulator
VSNPATASDNPYRRSLLRRERSRDTRRKLVRAAARLWSEKGYERTTVEEICAAAGVGRTTYYLHFETKEQLLLELSWATAAGVASDVESAVGAGGLDQQLQAFVDGVSRRVEGVPKSLAALALRTALSGIAQPRKPRDGVLFDDTLATVLRIAQRRGEIVAGADPGELGAILAGMTMDALQRWASGRDGGRDLRDSLHVRFELVLDGIRGA